MELFKIAQETLSGHSGRGNSYWEVAANCGHQRYLADTLPALPKEGPLPDWAVRGTYYHLLQEWYHRGTIPENQTIDLVDPDACEFPEYATYWQEAVTLHDWYKNTYSKTEWGQFVGAELQFPANDAERHKVSEEYGVALADAPTMRADMVTRMDWNDVMRVNEAHGLMLPGPGLYILDWKHGKQHAADDEKKYLTGVQSTLYLALANEFWEEKPKAMIFSKTSLTREKGKLVHKPTSQRLYVAYFEPERIQRAKGMIRHAAKSKYEQTKNGYACGSCPYFKTHCQGF